MNWEEMGMKGMGDDAMAKKEWKGMGRKEKRKR